MFYLKPSFYDDFYCIADKCTYSCCKYWTVTLDEETCLKYVYKGIKFNLDEEKNRCTMIMKQNGNCSMLDNKGFCKLVTKYGDDMLSYTCRTFPRNSNKIGDTKELYLSNACPYVLQLLKELNASLTFVMDDYTKESIDADNGNEQLLEDRNMLIDLLQISDLPLWSRLYMVFHYAWNLENAKDDEEKQKVRTNHNSVEYLLSLYDGISKIELSEQSCYLYRKNMLVLINEIVEKNEKWRQVYMSMCDYIANLALDTFSKEYHCFEEILSEYDMFFENFAVNMIFRHGCRRGNNLVFNTSLLAVEMSLIKFHLFVIWSKNDKKISWEDVKQMSCYYARNFEHGVSDAYKLLDVLFKGKDIDDGLILLMLK